MKKEVILRPAAGLANRMRAIDSAILLCRRIVRPLQILWFEDHALRAPFHRLFEPLSLHQVSLREASGCDFLCYDVPYRRRNLKLPLLYQWIRFRTNCRIGLWDSHSPEQVLSVFQNTSRACLVTSGSQMIPTEDRFSMFHPVEPVQRRIDELCASFDRERCIGVHVRRGDHRQATEHSPTQRFAARMREELDRGRCERFYLATDSEDVRGRMSSEFGDRIVTLDRPADRQTVAGIQDAVQELYTLSATSGILGSCGSTFGQTAAWMSGIPYTELRA